MSDHAPVSAPPASGPTASSAPVSAPAVSAGPVSSALAPSVRASSPPTEAVPCSSGALYPAFLRLAGRRVLLVGAGPVAASKVAALIAADAHITVVAPDIVSALEEVAAAHPTITLHRRPFVVSDLDGVWFVVAAATPAVNRAVSAAAVERQLFVNAVDDPPNATAYLGGIVRRAGVTIAISTDGQAPALAGLLREGLDALLPAELDAWMAEARTIRRTWMANRVPMEERRPLLLRALNDLYARRRVAAADATTTMTATTGDRVDSHGAGTGHSLDRTIRHGEDQGGHAGEPRELVAPSVDDAWRAVGGIA